MSRVLVAMSGGVDSSVAAALVQAEGHEVIGVTMKMWSGPNGEAPTSGCCTVSDTEDARRVAAQLDIPYYVLDYTDRFQTGVIDRFVDDYLHGRTPNPCVECNRTVKFRHLLEQADDFDCDVLVTGHYARIRRWMAAFSSCGESIRRRTRVTCSRCSARVSSPDEVPDRGDRQG
jgi:tRNA-uridine 2-sulfurtransferase